MRTINAGSEKMIYKRSVRLLKTLKAFQQIIVKYLLTKNRLWVKKNKYKLDSSLRFLILGIISSLFKKKAMKKKCIAFSIGGIFIVALIIGGCKKTTNSTDLDTTGKYYISFKANGEQVKYTNPVIVDSLPIGYDFGGYHVRIWEMGAANLQIHSMSLGILTEDSLPQSGRTYKESDIISGIWYGVIFAFNDSRGKYEYQSSGTYDSPVAEFYPDIPKDCTITLTDVGSNTLKGTFSGTVYTFNDNGEPVFTDKISITDGEFYLPASF